MGNMAELLAPAGNYDAFLGALNAGADAVYLGGEQFSARAYADNFDEKQIVRALHVAHFYGKKVYLTVNTLLKERELATLYAYLRPFYEAGLDGVIVQDFGVLGYLREYFPDLSLHASTQMTVTGVRGAALLKAHGVSRIVPARELSLEEVRKIRREADVEVECFIHGAMCYCYSGQCLFSSILGGRSGNRGRCAQPCRLPYDVFDGNRKLLENAYPLSLKDMCTLEYLPALLAAGIDSFKIEGRMKRPEYAAGVTAVYRKYIDLYYTKGADGFQVAPVDMDRLRGLYIRSDLQTGYYEQHNGKEMVSLQNPGYGKCDEHVLSRIREKYVREPDKMQVRLQARLQPGEPLCLRILHADEKEMSPAYQTPVQAAIQTDIQAEGERVQAARSAPLTEEEVRKRLCKTGESLLDVKECEITMEGACFVPVRALNALRRQTVEAFERAVIEKRGMLPEREAPGTCPDALEGGGLKERPKQAEGQTEKQAVHCLVTTEEQLQAVAVWGGCSRIYIESDLFLREADKIRRELESFCYGNGKESRTACYLALPYILRKRDEPYLRKLEKELAKTADLFRGFLVRSPESLSYADTLLKGWYRCFSAYSIVADAGLYCYNAEAVRFLSAYGREITLPYELNAGEAAHLVKAAKKLGVDASLIVYSRIPMMVTANCLRKTAGRCSAGQKGEGWIFLKDRMKAAFPVEINCDHCYNVIYNSVPYSLHGAKKERDQIRAGAYRYDFVTESGAECVRILEGKVPFTKYTTGHLKRGVD